MGWKISSEHNTEFNFVVVNPVSQIIPINSSKHITLGYLCVKWCIFWWIGMKYTYKCKRKKSWPYTHLQNCTSALPWMCYLPVYSGNCTFIEILPFKYCSSEDTDYWDFLVTVLFLVYYLYPIHIIIAIQTEGIYFYFRLHVCLFCN